MLKMLQQVKKYFKSITLEPMVLIFAFGMATLSGAQVTTNLLLWKLCTKDLNYTQEVCGNLSADANEDAENNDNEKK